MWRRRSPFLAAALGLSVLLSSAAIASVLSRSAPPAPTKPLAISGKVGGLFPGKTTTMKVTVRNPYTFVVKVVALSAKAGSPSASCPARAVAVRPWRGAARIAAQGHRTFRLRVRMKPTAPDGCQGVRFRLTYHAKAVRP